MSLRDIACVAVRFCGPPRDTIVSVLTLAIGVGFVSAAFAIVDPVLLRSLPYPSPDRLVRLWDVTGPPGFDVLSLKDVKTLQGATFLTGISGYADLKHRVASPSHSARLLNGQMTTTEHFEVLGARPAAGRLFTPGDGQLGSPSVVIISSRLASMLATKLGDIVTLDDLPYRIVGIMRPDFWFPDRTSEFWVPVVDVPTELIGAGSVDRQLRVIARLADQVTLDAARGQADALVGGRQSGRLRMQRFRDSLLAPVHTPLVLLQIGSVLLLLLTGLNAAWLFRVRAWRHERAFAIMTALGAPARGLAAVFLAEAALVAVLLIPAALAIVSLLLILAGRAENGVLMRFGSPGITWRVFGLTAVTAVAVSVTACIPGLMMVCRRASRNIEAMRSGRSVGTPAWRVNLSMALQASLVFAVTLQAVALVLILRNIFAINVGFRDPRFVGVQVTANSTPGASPGVVALQYQEAVDHLNRAGVVSAVTSVAPLTGIEHLTSARTPDRSVRDQTMVRVRAVSPSYFRVCGLELVEGRLPTNDEPDGGTLIVDETFSARVLAQGGSLGQRVLLGSAAWEVIGVVKQVRYTSIFEEPQPTVYLLYADVGRMGVQTASRLVREPTFLASYTGSSRATIDRVRQVLEEVLPGASIGGSWRFDDLIWLAAGERPLMTTGATTFAVLALVLLAIGFNGMLLYQMRSKRREIALRISLGATPGRIMAETLIPVASACAIGVLCGGGLAWLLRSAIFGVAFVPETAVKADTWSVAAVSVIGLAAAVALAVAYPAIKASQLNPSEILKQES